MARRRRMHITPREIKRYYSAFFLEKTKEQMAKDLGVSQPWVSQCTAGLPSKSEFLEPYVLRERDKGVPLRVIAEKVGFSAPQIMRIERRAKRTLERRRKRESKLGNKDK